MAPPILLDTCAAIWIANGDRIAPEALERLADAREAGQAIHICPMTAWEIGLLVAARRIALAQSPAGWFRALVGLPGVALAPMPPEVLIESSFLPDEPPRDPVDRIMIAMARHHGYQLMTRDKLILAFAARGHLQAIAC
jgi:PIN domain nuclease of toxin-antitoxin system